MQQQRFLDLLEAFSQAARHFLTVASGRGACVAARRFLAAQGIDWERLDRLPVGFCPDCAAMKDALRQAGYTSDEIDASELADDPRLAERLMGSIRDVGGLIRGFWARHPRGAKPQYLFKGRWQDEVPAIGLDVAFPALDGGRLPLILVESPLDVLLLQSRGFLHAAAIGGAAGQLTRKRWERFARLGVRHVILVLRTDEIGLRGAAAAVENAARVKLPLQVSVLAPERLEGVAGPGDFVRGRGVPAFRALFEPQVEVPPLVSEPPPPAPAPPPPPVPPPSPAPPSPPTVRRRCRQGYCTLHQCEETDCFCFD